MNPAYLLLEDGRRFEGQLLGAEGVAIGEVVFNTSMTGYQEILTDPSYSGQLVLMTYPLIGNYGVNDQDQESSRPHVSGFIVREMALTPSSWRSRGSLGQYLVRHGIVAIGDVDTRALARHLSSQGAMRGAIVSSELDEQEVQSLIQAHPQMAGLDLAAGVSTKERYTVPAVGEERFHVVAFDFGVKSSSPEMLAALGCRVTVVPADTATDQILAMKPHGIFLSNGPGDPAAVGKAADTVREAAAKDIPVFGICLGHQLIARAFGGDTYKLPFGHHGGNHPVKNHALSMVEITSQNHGFAVSAGDGDEVAGCPDLQVTHTNLYDGTVAGLVHRTLPVMAVQYHPEAAPGPHDSRYLFDDFVKLMEARSS